LGACGEAESNPTEVLSKLGWKKSVGRASLYLAAGHEA